MTGHQSLSRKSLYSVDIGIIAATCAHIPDWTCIQISLMVVPDQHNCLNAVCCQPQTQAQSSCVQDGRRDMFAYASGEELSTVPATPTPHFVPGLCKAIRKWYNPYGMHM